jgi:hypothetical protein
MSNNNLFFNSEEIRDLPLRTEFVTGPAGPTGNQGEAGAGITIGGITGQVLAKKSNANYDTEWINSVVSWGTITGTLSNQTDLQNVLNAKAPSTGISPSAISGTAVITTDARLSDSRSPNGSATGDLDGTYPAPSVAKLQGYSVSATSPSIGQILQWGGESWLPAAIPQGGSGGGGVNYFFNFNEAAIAPITGLPTSPQSAARLSRFATITQSAITSAHLSQVAYDLVAGFVSDPADPNVTQIPAGLWDFNIWADSNANSSNECILRLFVYKYNGTTTTLLSESDDIYLYDPTVINQYSASVVFPFTTILATDRIYIELRGKATKNNIHISLHFGNVTPSHAHTTFSSVAGTGVVKVINGVFQTPANLIFDADVSATADIAQGKILGLTSDLAGKAGIAQTNTFSAPQVISGDSDSTMLRVTQLGAGEAIRVEDETSPDSTAFVISNSGRVGIGVSPDSNVCLSVNSSGIKFSDGSIQASSATGIKTVLAQTTENVSGSVSGNDFLVTGTALLVVDGYIPSVGGIVVFAAQTNSVQNGFWRVKVNNGQTQPILERPTWFGLITTNVSNLVYITRFGATQAGFVMALTGPLGNSNIVVGTTALTAHRISGRAPTVGIVATPAASNSAGTIGQIAVDNANNFLYVCTAANVWKRTALTTF